MNLASIKEYLRNHLNDTGRERSEDVSSSRPRVQVTGPKIKPLICQICLGRIKDDCEYVKCASGKVFHSVCLNRTGGCPYCQRKHYIRGKESQIKVSFGELPVVEEPTIPVVEAPVERTFSCPVCGSKVMENSDNCACGAIFVKDNGVFVCPGCGGKVDAHDKRCFICGEHFDQYQPFTCPLCGRAIPPRSEICGECGAVLSSRCPECGTELSDTDMTCPNCKATFEFV